MQNKNKLKTIKEKFQDFSRASLEEGISIAMESLPELGNKVAEVIGNETISTTVRSLTGGVVSAVAPAFLGITLSYQQKRTERNVMQMVDSIVQKQHLIEERLTMLNADVQQKFISGTYRDAMLDNIISENQEQKVQYNINGYINLMGIENPNDDVIFTFFQTLSQMNELDIRVLKIYKPLYEIDEGNHESIMDIMEDENIDQSQCNFIREKLYRLGMLESKNEGSRDENLDILGETLTNLIKQLYSKNPKQVKEPKLKRIWRTDTYKISRLGREYLDFISEPQ